eukprot:Skav236731  [mRNA]  locus=scaffold8096:6013:7347:- [translate_table: standard]
MKHGGVRDENSWDAGDELEIAALLPSSEALQEYPDVRVRNLRDLEAVLQLRLVIGTPPKTGTSDPDGVGIVDWQLAIYSGAGGVEAALNFIHYILEIKVRKGYITRMPALAARLLLQDAPVLPAPWQAVTDDSVVIPKAFAALPPKGRRHVLSQLDPQERENDASDQETYMLTFYGGVYPFKDRLDGYRVPGALLPTGNDKQEYVRYLECSLDAESQERVRAVLGTALLGVPLYFINGARSGDPMAAWLLQQPSVIDGEAPPAETSAPQEPGTPAAGEVLAVD